MIFKITAQTNFSKTNNFSASLRVSADSNDPAPERDAEEIKRENAIKDICLNCTKEKCKGTEKCFLKERDKRK